jgi:hypothetical protein
MPFSMGVLQRRQNLLDEVQRLFIVKAGRGTPYFLSA